MWSSFNVMREYMHCKMGEDMNGVQNNRTVCKRQELG